MAIDERASAVLDRLYADDERQRQQGLPTEQRTRNLTPASGQFLKILARAMGATRALEIGSSNGVSTIWLAMAMRETGGTVIGTEVIPERAAQANDNLAAAGLSQYATVLSGDAANVIDTVTGPIDLVFLDAEKEDYSAHFERVFPLLRIGGTVIADNVISHDCTEYQEMVRSRSDCETLTIPLDRGLELTVRVR
jgi:predicted O-methyltransferase YrrM